MYETNYRANGKQTSANPIVTELIRTPHIYLLLFICNKTMRKKEQLVDYQCNCYINHNNTISYCIYIWETSFPQSNNNNKKWVWPWKQFSFIYITFARFILYRTKFLLFISFFVNKVWTWNEIKNKRLICLCFVNKKNFCKQWLTLK